MNDWFEWNGKRCTEYGIHVSEQPPLTLPAERVTFTDVPGRSGSLTTLEGEDVYEDMVLTAQCFIQSGARVPEIAAWLRGSGTVTFAGWKGSYGYLVIITHDNGVQTYYAHNSSLLVSAGESVTKGQRVALVGGTGHVTGPHLHLELTCDGVYYNPEFYLS